MSKNEDVAKRRVGLMVAASWAFATVITGLVVWRAVAVLDDGTRTDVLSGAEVSGLLASASATPGTTAGSGASVTIPPASTEPATSSAGAPGTTATTGAASGPTGARTNWSPATKIPSPVPTPVVRTWTVAGGVVSVACTSQAISLLSASPADGWRVKIENRGPDRVKLEFSSGETDTKVGGTCVSGVPQPSSTVND
jgi:hypothetical protein